MKKIKLDSPYISPRAVSYVDYVLNSYIAGQPVDSRRAFEKKAAEYLGVKYAYACNSGTNALHIALLALNIPAGSEVITNPLTNIATISAILKCECKPVFPTVGEDGLFDEQDLKKRINRKTKAIIPVHFNGYGEDLKSLVKIAKEKGLFILEDASQAFGAMMKMTDGWGHLGTIGDIGVYSFGGGKVLSTVDGGMVVTHGPSLARRLDKLLGTGEYTAAKPVLGFNSRMDALRSAIGLANLKDLGPSIEVRKKLWMKYRESLCRYSWLEVMPVGDDCRINYSSFVLKVGSKRTRKLLLLLLKDVNYHMNVVRQERHPNAYAIPRYMGKEILEAMDRMYESHVALPVHSHISDRDIQNILGCFHKADELCQR